MDASDKPGIEDHFGQMSPYTHQPLASGHIRLLRVCWTMAPSLKHVFPWTEPQKTLELQTSCVDLDEEREYSAVSYVWGEDPASVAILCNAEPLLVTPSAYEMLAHLDDDKEYWVDAVCIDQNNLDEKALQIPFMYQVYSRADRVLIWLGCSDPYLDAFMADAQRVFALAEDWQARDRTGRADWRGKDWPVDGSDWWHGWNRFIGHPWFERLWTFQEVALARPGSAYMLYDTTDIHVSSFFDFFIRADTHYRSYLSIDDNNFDPVTGEQLRNPHGHAACYLLSWALDDQQHPEQGPLFLPSDLPWIFYHLCSRKAKEEVDKVWALVGLLPANLRNHLQSLVDYSPQARRDYWKTWISFARAILEVGQCFALLNIPPPISGPSLPLPSWAPNLSLEYSECSLRINGTWFSSLDMDEPTTFFPVVPNEPQLSIDRKTAIVRHPSKLIRFVEKGTVLQARGFVVDTVKETVCMEKLRALWHRSHCDVHWLDGNFFDEPRIEIIKFFIKALELAQWTCLSPGSAASSIPEQFVMCLFCDSRVSETALDVCRHLFDILMPDRQDQRVTLDEQSKEDIVYLGQNLQACIGHSFFATELGRFGIATPGLQVGDKVCVFYGGEPLYILRDSDSETGSCTTFQGVAFIPHLMYQDERDAAKVSDDEIFGII